MPRTSRSVAQRLAAQGKSRKRRQRAPGAPAPTSTVADQEVADAVAEGAAGAGPALKPMAPRPDGATPAAPPRPARAPARSGGSPRAPATSVSARLAATARLGSRALSPKRRYHEYGDEYAYVWSDLQRIFVVAVALIALLVVLSFFLQ